MDGVAVAVALGSNVGDRRATLTAAADALRPIISELRLSTFHDTPYVAVGSDAVSGSNRTNAGQPSVLNAALVGVTSLDPHALLERLLAVEQDFGRTRPYGGAPRTLDLDLILYGDAVIDEPGLVVPHPRVRERGFVLDPLVEIAAGWRDPVTGRTIQELQLDLRSRPAS